MNLAVLENAGAEPALLITASGKEMLLKHQPKHLYVTQKSHLNSLNISYCHQYKRLEEFCIQHSDSLSALHKQKCLLTFQALEVIKCNENT